MDFNNSETVARSSSEIEQLTILEARYNFLTAREEASKMKLRGVNADLSIMRARLETIFWVIEATLKRKDKEKWEELAESINDSKTLKYEDLMYIYTELSGFLDALEVTKIDVRERKSRNLEERNKNAGYK